MTSFKPLVYEYRNNVLDVVHSGYICVVDENSRVIGHVGSPEQYVFYRSASKPIQALDTIAFGLDKKYGITGEESVLFAGSHIADEEHVNALSSILKKAGIDEDMLYMPPTLPQSVKNNEKRIREGTPLRKIYHNCSGMHISQMLLQRELGGDLKDYWKAGAPANKQGQKTVSFISEIPEAEVGLGTDGCGVPVFAVPMKNIAAAFKNLACADTVKDDRLAEAIDRFIPLYNKYPLMIRGEGYICSLLNKDPNIVAKGGSAGVYAIGLKKERLGISLKLADGTENTWPLIILEIFKQIGYNNPETLRMLESFDNDTIYNDNKVPVGFRKAVFKLR